MAEKKVINFNINDQRIAEVAEEFKDIDAYQDLDSAKAAKKILTKMRTTLGEAHKEQKSEALRFGQRLDAEKRRLLELIAEVEDPITDQLTEIKNAAAKKEEERIAAIESRILFIREHGSDLEGLTVAQLEEYREQLEEIELDSTFEELLPHAEAAKAEAEARLRIAIRKTQDREEEEARIEEKRKANAAKEAELEEARKALEKEQQEMRDKQAERERIAREEQAKKDAERQAGLDAQAEANRREQERLATEKAEREERDREERERKDAEEKEALRLAQAPDVEKLRVYGESIKGLADAHPTMQSEQGQMTINAVLHRLEETRHFIDESTEEMK